MKKVILITGASAGIGKTAVRQLLKEGHVVYGVARRVEKMSDLKAEGARIKAMDLTEDSSMVDGVHEILQEQGRIDVLVNNAGYGSYGAIEDVEISEAKRQFEVNLFGLARLTQLVLPQMRKQKSGKIINVSSMGGKLYTPLGGWYHATKFALEGWSDCLRLETKPFGIDVVVVEPGGIKTEWGGIAVDHMLKTSGDTAYGEITKKVSEIFKKEEGRSPPQVIADVLSKAIRSKHPKTRYVAGSYAKPFLALRRIASDRMFDKVVETFFRL